jgi:hypothetical protein
LRESAGGSRGKRCHIALLDRPMQRSFNASKLKNCILIYILEPFMSAAIRFAGRGRSRPDPVLRDRRDLPNDAQKRTK